MREKELVSRAAGMDDLGVPQTPIQEPWMEGSRVFGLVLWGWMAYFVTIRVSRVRHERGLGFSGFSASGCSGSGLQIADGLLRG